MAKLTDYFDLYTSRPMRERKGGVSDQNTAKVRLIASDKKLVGITKL